MLALGLALSSIVLGHLILVPMLRADHALVDATSPGAGRTSGVRTAELRPR
jgi:hypothetical protein